MSLTTQTLKRLPYIQQGLHEGLNRQQIGQACGVTEKTIDRDMNAWVESGLFEIWIKKEFVETYPDIKREDKVLAFQEIAKLVGKMLTRKIERKEQIDIRQIIVKMWKPPLEENQIEPTT
jgi:DNA-binding transcriptional regulator LsrR (DeoR family)